jgi:heme-degrading monooxygenase HmoA
MGIGSVFCSQGGGMVVVVFRSRLKTGIEKDIEEADARMAELAAGMPGFVSYRQFMRSRPGLEP